VEGSTAATHDDNVLVEIEPRFYRHDALVDAKEEILSWPHTLYQEAQTTIDWATETYQADLGISTDLFKILAVKTKPYDSNDRWLDTIGWSLIRDLDADDFASGFGISLRYPYGVATTMEVTYAAPFTTATVASDTDLESTVGLSTPMVDVLRVGLTWRLLATREVGRSDLVAQGQPRNAEDVQAGVMAQQANFLKQLRDEKISEEALRLARRWPTRYAG